MLKQKLKKLINGRRSTRKQESGNSLTTKQQLQKELSQKWSYHSILLGDFIEQVISGTVDQDIYSEFIYAIKDKEQQYADKLMKDINLLESKYNQAMTIVKYFECIEKLRTYNSEFVHEDEEQVWKLLISLIPVRKGEKLQVIATRCARLLNEIENKKAELNQVNKVSSGSTKADRTYFNRMIVTVQVSLKIPTINRKETLLCEFVELYIVMREQQEYLERELNKSKK